ncbi:MAG: penicillin acylase family protein [Deltaproteobacteria bacterium]|nr:penicillin acylase family protein [Deltaproteobacteria bacterium]
MTHWCSPGRAVRWLAATTWALAALAACSDGAEPKSTSTSDTANLADTVGDTTSPADTAGDADAAAVDTAPGPDTFAWTEPKFSAKIRWTSYGIPHIQGATLGDVAFGQGYAFAKENLCTLADQLVKVRSERAASFGPGTGDANVASDFAYKALRVMDYAHQKWAATGDKAISAEVRSILEGYAAGYNRRLAEAGPGGWPTACKNAPWVKPASPVDLLAYYHDLALLASGRNLRKYLADAHPPAKQGSAALPAWLLRDDWQRWSAAAEGLQTAGAELADLREHAIGSNGWGVGKERTASGSGIVLGNPHFPWFGELRLWESHLTVPGVLDVQGATLSGVPMVLIGHNAHAAFTATVSASSKFTVYKLKLDPADPTTYLVDGKPAKMKSFAATIQVKQPDGTLKAVSRTFWRTDFGPIAVIPGIAEWSAEQAWALRDGNEGNSSILEHFLRIDQAKSVEDIQNVCATISGNPWTNTMAADDAGSVFYSESQSTPNLSKACRDEWQAAAGGGDLFVKLAWENGMILLDGSKSQNSWVEEPGARMPGLVPYSKVPHALRKDYVLNANDSHWLSNLQAPLEGYPFPFGPEGTTRSQRTRLNLKMATEVSPTGASGEDGKFTADELRAMIHNGRANTAEVYREELVARCKPGIQVQAVLASGAPSEAVDLSEACSVLAAWDGTLGPESPGAVLWREFWAAPAPSPFFYVPFDAKDPIGTPKTLKPAPATGDDPYLVQLGRAVLVLKKAGLPLTTTLGEQQYTMKDTLRIAIPGGYHSEGVFQVIGGGTSSNDTLLPTLKTQPAVVAGTPLTTAGYPVAYGSSFVMVVEMTASGPQGQAILSYSQSTDPASANFADQTQLFSQRKFRPMLWNDADIAKDPAYQLQTVAN